MSQSASLLRLIALARIARTHIETLAMNEYLEVGMLDWENAGVVGYCGIAARYLEMLANDNGIYPVFVVGQFRAYDGNFGEYQTVSGHAWLEHCGYIIDITADQFKAIVPRTECNFNKRVYVCKSSSLYFLKWFVGPRAKEEAGSWYVEPLDELCKKTQRIMYDGMK